MAGKSAAEWQAIEGLYRSGEVSIREIAGQYGLSDTAVHKRAAAHGWERKPVQKKRRSPTRQPAAPPQRQPDATVDASGIADDGRALVLRMLDELDTITTRRGELEEFIIAATEQDENDKRQDAMLRSISLATRANTLKTLALALKSINEASAPQGVKAKRQEKAGEVAGRFRAFAPPDLKVVS